MTDAERLENTAIKSSEAKIDIAAVDAASWFVECAKVSLGDNLLSATVYGPAVTRVFDTREHQIHFLLVLASRNVDELLNLARHSKQAARKRISPPLVMTEYSMKQSRDVFPLEWLDISHFHRTILGQPIDDELSLDRTLVRLQCERELRSLDIHLQQGILASGGKESRIGRLEEDSADSLIRVLRGISWLNGDREKFLPTELLTRCVEITKVELLGCGEAVKFRGRHDMQVVKSMLMEIAALSEWVDAQRVGAT